VPQPDEHAEPIGPALRGAVLGALALLAVVYALGTAADIAMATWLYPATTVGCTAAGWWGLRRHTRPGSRGAWALLLGGIAAYGLGDLVWTAWYVIAGSVGDVSAADGAYLLGAGLLIAGALRLAAARLGAHDIDSITDAVAVGATVMVLAWGSVIAPILESDDIGIVTTAVVAAFPIADIVLLSVAIRLLLVPGGRTVPAVLVLVAGVVWVVADCAYAVGIEAGWYSDTAQIWLDELWLIASMCIAAALLHPRLARSSEPLPVSEDVHVTRSRLAVSALALLAAPVALFVADRVDARPDTGVVLATAFVSTTLVLWRLARVSLAGERARSALGRKEAYFRDLVEHSSDVTLVVDATGHIREITGSAVSVLGRSPADLHGRLAGELIHPDDLDRCAGMLASCAAEPDAHVYDEFRAIHADGTTLWMSARLTNRLDASPVGGIVANLHDITARKQAELELTHQALHDGLTGLANRSLLVDRLAHSLQRRRPGGVGLLYLDLDRFKVVNDSLGHSAGDELLVAVAERLSSAVRSCDTVARLGGDEFAVLLEPDGEPVTEDLALELAARLLDAVRAPITVGSTSVVVATSIGVALAAPQATAHDLLRDADVALYAAKAQGRDRAALFDTHMQSVARDRLELENDLRHAIEHDELRVRYQPIVDMDAMVLVGFEALVRWQHPERGLVGPDTFIPIAEETGLVVPIGAWVLHQACAAAASWHMDRDCGRPLTISVNVSAVQVADQELTQTVAEVLAATRLEPEHLVLELTETALVRDPEVAAARLHDLKALGVRIAIDDFGTGYSSLGYLRQFPIDVLKIDRSFLDPITAELGLPPIVRGVLELGATMGLTTIAEGVETDAQMARLIESGCRYGQGYLFARPLAPEDAAELARRTDPILDPTASRTTTR
jgi:diguanylate cyclase (GGDEF)-like protein/PAS domain S-box-containing protein